MFDEADLLLCGSFQNQVIRLINMFRYEEKSLSKKEESLIGSENKDEIKSWVDFKPEDCNELEPVCSTEDEDAEGNVDGESFEEEITTENTCKKDRLRNRKTYKRSKQYIFVAATLPESGKRTAGGILRRMFPDASFVSGNFLHCHNPRFSFSCTYLFFVPIDVFQHLPWFNRVDLRVFFWNCITDLVQYSPIKNHQFTI